MYGSEKVKSIFILSKQLLHFGFAERSTADMKNCTFIFITSMGPLVESQVYLLPEIRSVMQRQKAVTAYL